MKVLLSLTAALLVAAPSGAAPIQLQAPRTHGGFNAFAYSTDGKLLAGGSGAITMTTGGKVTSTGGGEVLLWDPANGRLLAALGSHGSHVRWVGFSADGKVLASASPDNATIKTWDVVARKPLATLKPDESALATAFGNRPLCAISPDGRWVAAVGEETQKVGTNNAPLSATLTVWDARSGKVAWSLPRSEVGTLAFTRDSSRLVAVARTLNWKPEGDGIAASSTDIRLLGWNATSGTQAFRTPLAGTPSSALLFPAKGSEFLAWDRSRAAWYDSGTGAKTRDQRVPQGKRVISPRLDASGSKVLALEFPGDKVVALDLNAGTSTVLLPLRGYPGQGANADIAPDLHHVVVAPMGMAPAILDF